MKEIFLSQTSDYTPQVVQQRIITNEEEDVVEPGQVAKPVPSFIYFILAILLMGVVIWAIKKFHSLDVPKTLSTNQVKQSLNPVKRSVISKK